MTDREKLEHEHRMQVAQAQHAYIDGAPIQTSSYWLAYGRAQGIEIVAGKLGVELTGTPVHERIGSKCEAASSLDRHRWKT